jgi:hypothetical protein
MPVDAATGKDAAARRDARLDESVTDEGRTDASTADAKDGPGGLPCPSANFDVSADVCANDVGIRSILAIGTCGDYRVVENATNGDNHVYYYFDASGALVAIVHSSGPGYFCSAGLVAVIPPPCIYLNSPSATRLYCGTDGGTSDRPQF